MIHTWRLIRRAVKFVLIPLSASTSTHFQLCYVVMYICSNMCVGHGHGYGCRSSLVVVCVAGCSAVPSCSLPVARPMSRCVCSRTMIRYRCCAPTHIYIQYNIMTYTYIYIYIYIHTTYVHTHYLSLYLYIYIYIYI